jgi:tRNA G26 N,N-dimethylase Trm1
MSVQDCVQCPQCGNREADFVFSNYREVTLCNHCGYRETWDPQYDDGKCCGWKHEIRNGAGALWYRPIGSRAFTCASLQTNVQVRRAKRWLRQQLINGTVESKTAYLARWNSAIGRVDLILGSFNAPQQIPSDFSHCSDEREKPGKGDHDDQRR